MALIVELYYITDMHVFTVGASYDVNQDYLSNENDPSVFTVAICKHMSAKVRAPFVHSKTRTFFTCP